LGVEANDSEIWCLTSSSFEDVEIKYGSSYFAKATSTTQKGQDYIVG